MTNFQIPMKSRFSKPKTEEKILGVWDLVGHWGLGIEVF